MRAADLHQAVEAAFNAADVDGLVALYEPGASLLGDDGEAASGHDAIREAWGGLTSLGGTIRMTTRSAVEVGDLALLSNEWCFELGGDVVASSITAEVARRQPDGSWRYVIDHPYAAPVAPA